MNILQAKALFLALYMGQKILCIRNKPEPVLYVGFDDLVNGEARPTDYVLVRTVNMLTDEEVISIGRSVGLVNCEISERDNEVIMIVDDSYYLGLYCDGTVVMYKEHGLNRKPFWNDIDSVYQTLRLFGIITKFKYLNESNQPITLTPAQLVEMGWAKIKTV